MPGPGRTWAGLTTEQVAAKRGQREVDSPEAKEWSDLMRRNSELEIEVVKLRGALEYSYRCVNFGFEWGSFDFSVLRKEAKAYFGLAAATDVVPVEDPLGDEF